MMTTTSASKSENDLYAELLVWITGLSTSTLPEILYRHGVKSARAAKEMYNISARFHRNQIPKKDIHQAIDKFIGNWRDRG